jgi:hypothetical protein
MKTVTVTLRVSVLLTSESDGNTVNLEINGFQATPPVACRSLFDGSVVDKPTYSDECGQQAYPGPATLPVVDVPDLTTITSSEGQKYIVRQLKPRIVYPEVDMANCASLTVRDTLAVENHTFFESHSLDTALPKGGAVLVNDFFERHNSGPKLFWSDVPAVGRCRRRWNTQL